MIRAACRTIETTQDVEHSRLSRSGGPHDGYKLSSGNVEGNSPKGFHTYFSELINSADVS
jgi:hypothetical protein